MSYQYIKGAISCSNNTAYTGSFVKLKAVGPLNQSASLDRVEWGTLTEPEVSSSVAGVATTKLVLLSGDTLDGPIMRFKTNTSNGVECGIIAYTGRKS